jgi:ribosome-associated protein
LAQAIARAAKSIKAENVDILDVSKIAGFCDYFVIASGNSLRQAAAIAQAIQDDLDKIGIKSLSKVPRGDASGWLVLDYVAVIAHSFYKPMREFYSLESLWSDAKKVRVSAAKK